MRGVACSTAHDTHAGPWAGILLLSFPPAAAAKVTPLLQSWDNGSNTFKKTVLFRVKCNKCTKNATYSFPREKALEHLLE